VPPAITEVIFVAESLAFMINGFSQTVLRFVQCAHLTEFVILRVAEDLLFDLEHMQVRVRPAHDDLDGFVQPVQGDIGGYKETPPDGRRDAVQGYFELVDRCRFGRIGMAHLLDRLRILRTTRMGIAPLAPHELHRSPRLQFRRSKNLYSVSVSQGLLLIQHRGFYIWQLQRLPSPRSL